MVREVTTDTDHCRTARFGTSSMRSRNPDKLVKGEAPKPKPRMAKRQLSTRCWSFRPYLESALGEPGISFCNLGNYILSTESDAVFSCSLFFHGYLASREMITNSQRKCNYAFADELVLEPGGCIQSVIGKLESQAQRDRFMTS